MGSAILLIPHLLNIGCQETIDDVETNKNQLNRIQLEVQKNIKIEKKIFNRCLKVQTLI